MNQRYWKQHDEIDGYTFLVYWTSFHNRNPQRKHDKTACEKIWDNCHDAGRKKNIILGLQKTKSRLTAYEYLKQKL